MAPVEQPNTLISHLSSYIMGRSTLKTALMVGWTGLHTAQYGLAISSLNGIQVPLTCAGPGGKINLHAVTFYWHLRYCIDMTPAQFGLVVSIFTLGGLLGALSANSITGRLGRVGTLRASSTAVMIGSAVVGLSNSLFGLLLGRVIIGLGCGLATVTVPVFLAEIAPPSMKRSLGIANQVCIVLGMLLGQGLSFPFSRQLLWRYVLVIPVGIALFQLLASVLVKEPQHEVVDEEARLLANNETELPNLSIRELFTSKDPRETRGFLVVIVTQIAQQLCGVSPVMYFSTRILTPVFQSNSRLIALFIIMLKIPVTLVPAFIIERTGSRRLLLFPTAGMAIAAILLGVGINTDAQALSVCGILAFVAFFSMGLGPVTWVVLPEVMPKHAVTAAGSVGLALNWMMNFCMGAAFLPLQHWLSGGKVSGEGNIFFVLAATCAVAVFAMRTAFVIRAKVDA